MGNADLSPKRLTGSERNSGRRCTKVHNWNPEFDNVTEFSLFQPFSWLGRSAKKKKEITAERKKERETKNKSAYIEYI